MHFMTITEQTPTAAPEAGDAQAIITEGTAAKAKATWLAPTLVLAAVAVFGFVTLLNYPVTGVDETWNANRAWSFLQTGHQFASVDSGVYQQYDGYWTYWPYPGTLIHAVFIWLFGVSLASVRLASLFFGLVLLTAVYFIARKLYGQRAAVIAMALLATSAPFVLSSHMARHDIIVAALGFGAVALYFTDGKSSLTIKSVLSGLAIGLALDIHPNALIFGPIMLTLFLLDYGKRIFRTGRFWGFALGGSLGVLFFVAMHILPYPQTYFAFQHWQRFLPHTTCFAVDLGLWRSSLLGTIDYLDLLILPVMVPAAIFLIRRQSRSDIRALALFGISILSMAAVIREKSPFYAILIAPTVPLMVAPYLDNITQRIGKFTEWTFWRNFIVISIVIVVGCINLSPAIHGKRCRLQEGAGLPATEHSEPGAWSTAHLHTGSRCKIHVMSTGSSSSYSKRSRPAGRSPM